MLCEERVVYNYIDLNDYSVQVKLFSQGPWVEKAGAGWVRRAHGKVRSWVNGAGSLSALGPAAHCEDSGFYSESFEWRSDVT